MKFERFLKGCDRTISFSFLGLVYFIPISTALVEIFSTIILTTYFTKRTGVFIQNYKTESAKSVLSRVERGFLFFRSYCPVRNPLNRPLGALLAINLLSVLISHYPLLSLQGFFCKLVQGTFLYFSFLESIVKKKQLKMFINIYIISISLISLNGLAQFFTGKGFVHRQTLMDGRVMSSLNHPNDYGSYILIAAIFVYTLFLAMSGLLQKRDDLKACDLRMTRTTKLFLRLGLGLLFVAATANLGMTFSRGAWGGFVLGLLLLCFVERRTFVYSAVVVIIFFTVFSPRMVKIRNVSFVSDDVATTTRIDREQELLNQEESFQIPKKEKAEPEMVELVQEVQESEPRSPLLVQAEKIWSRFSGMGRDNFWREALSIIRRYPALGVGLNTYSQVAPEYKVSWGGYPHNCYLQMAAETGLLGLGAFVWVFGALFTASFRSLRAMKDCFLRAVCAGVLAGLFGFMVHSFFDTNFYSVQLGNFMWLCMAVVVAAQMIETNSTEK